MKFYQKNNTFIIGLELGEEILKSLTDFCQKEKIQSGTFTAVGAISYATLSAYDLQKKEYLRQNFDEPLEIANLTGNIASFENTPIIHCHATLGRHDFSTISGHLDKAVVSATCEVFINKLDIQINRKHNENIGLKLLDI